MVIERANICGPFVDQLLYSVTRRLGTLQPRYVKVYFTVCIGTSPYPPSMHVVTYPYDPHHISSTHVDHNIESASVETISAQLQKTSPALSPPRKSPKPRRISSYEEKLLFSMTAVFSIPRFVYFSASRSTYLLEHEIIQKYLQQLFIQRQWYLLAGRFQSKEPEAALHYVHCITNFFWMAPFQSIQQYSALFY